ncbi:MAG: zinc-dependent peptidase [Pseudomonadota bacterium]|jgi:Mlc titration factor MtfA (ptsG expression regulator)
MLDWLRRRVARAPTPVADAAWSDALSSLRLLDGRTEDDLARLRVQVARFLDQRSFSTTHGLELTDRMRLLVAAQACLPLVHLPFEALGHWHEVILYPGQFRVRRSHHDSDTEVVSEWDDELAGEAWSQGPVILSWADIEADLAAPFEGFNVVVHEIAHKIDMADGDSDGIPPFADVAARRRWRSTMQRCFDTLSEAVDRGEETVLDPYAAESPDEFFAVCAEYYFSAPDVLAEHHPEVHAEFARYFGPVPMPAS